MKTLAKRALFVAVALCVLVLSAAAANTPSQKVKQVDRPVVAVAMDGPRVVYSTDRDAVRVWNVTTGASSQARPAGKPSNPLVREVAIAGTRVAWITFRASGNTHETLAHLKVATPPTAARLVASAFRRDGESEDGVELWNGKWLTGLTGAGKLVVLSRWTATDNVVSDASLSVVDPRGRTLHVIARGEHAIVSASVDAGRIAVLRPDGTVGVLSSTGRLVLEVTPSSAKELAFGGGRLVVLTETKTVEVFDARSGTLLHTWPVHANGTSSQAGFLSAYGRIAAYVVTPGRSRVRLHVMDLLTGKELVLAPSYNLGCRNAVVGARGLVYAVNHYRFGAHPQQSGTLVFVPTARVLAMLGD